MYANSVLKPCRWRRQPRSGKYARMHQLAWAPKLVRDAKGVPTRLYVSPKTCQWCQRDRIWAKKLVGEVTSISHPIQFAALVCQCREFSSVWKFSKISYICCVFFYRYCVCTVFFGTTKILKPFRTHLLKYHPVNCSCDCVSCASGTCRPSVVDLNLIQSHLLCPRQHLLHGSECHCFTWECLELKFKYDTCFLNKPSLLGSDRSAFMDPTIVAVTKWEKWEQITHREMW